METHTKVVVIGGGVVGCSILFHLDKFGLKDLILIQVYIIQYHWILIKTEIFYYYQKMKLFYTLNL